MKPHPKIFIKILTNMDNHETNNDKNNNNNSISSRDSKR